MIWADSCREINVLFGSLVESWGVFGTWWSIWNQSSFWLTVEAKSLVLKRTLGDFWKHLVGLWKLGEHLHGAQRSFWHIVASKSMVSREPLGASGSIGEHSHGAQSSFWQTVAAKALVFRGRGWLQDGPKRDFGIQL